MERDSGDEFKIVVLDDVAACKRLAKIILENVRKIDFEDIADNLHMTVTIGIASSEVENNSFSRLLHLAGSAMYEAKGEESGTYKVYSE
jgi:PleD family two-component response regulator